MCSTRFGLCLPDIVERGLGLWLRQLGEAIRYVHRFVLPAASMAGFGKDLTQGCSALHSAVPSCQFGRIHSPAFELEQNGDIKRYNRTVRLE
jgi:hypothetical protein